MLSPKIHFENATSLEHVAFGFNIFDKKQINSSFWNLIYLQSWQFLILLIGLIRLISKYISEKPQMHYGLIQEEAYYSSYFIITSWQLLYHR